MPTPTPRTSASRTYDALLSVSKSSVTMSGIWPGRYGATAIMAMTYRLEENFAPITLQITDRLRKMHRNAGRETTKELFRCLRHHNLSVGNAMDHHVSADIDGRQFYNMLEEHMVVALSKFGGCFRKGPFVLSLRFLPEQIRDLATRQFYESDLLP